MRFEDSGLTLNDERLRAYAMNCAAGEIRGRSSVKRVYKSLCREVKKLRSCAGKLPYLRENLWLVEAEKSAVGEILRSRPPLRSLSGASEPLVFTLSEQLISAVGEEITGERIKIFLSEYQKKRPLDQEELWLFPAALRTELLFLLCCAASKNDEKRVKSAIKAMFTLKKLDFPELMESIDPVEAILRRDRAGVYPLMDDETRFSYRLEIAKTAKKRHITEIKAAEQALNQGNEHIGFYIFPKKEKKPALYIALNALLTLAATLLIGSPLALLPASELAKRVTDAVAARIWKPKRLPSLDFSKGIPKAGKTICVISALLTSEKDGEEYARLLRNYAITNENCGENLYFGLLADLSESKSVEKPEDRAILAAAKKAMEALGERFLLLTRSRTLLESDGIYMGRERKRGAISELTALLTGGKSELKVLSGDAELLKNTNFILTLDADTRLTAGSAAELIGAALHPLNRPVIDERRGVVREGCGIIQPRMTVEPDAASKSLFSMAFAGHGGMDPYSGVSSEVYQDLFSRATFMGKGLINVPAARRVLDGALPENAILSHDIIEGAYLGCAAKSDVETSEGWPCKVTSYYSRLDRWTRGDWQNIRFLGGKIRVSGTKTVDNPISALDKYKIFDNLRRSLVPAGELAAILCGLILGGGFTAPALFALIVTMAELFETGAAELRRWDGTVRPRYHSTVLHGFTGAAVKAALTLVLLPADAWVRLRAALTALWRMAVSKRRLLSWVTASEAERRHGNTIYVNYVRLAPIWISGLAVLTLSPVSLAGLPWLLGPLLAWYISRPVPPRPGLSPNERGFLLARAGELWAYFDSLLTPSDSFLPPDNHGFTGTAHRTSPTNIGLGMLSCAAAAELGLVEADRAAELIANTLGTVERLEKWHGHLLNWYDTRAAEALEPRFVSTVDSGNFVACLIAVREALSARGYTETAERCGKIIENTDFRPLYNYKRHLFHVGFDPEKGENTESLYDLFSGEARLTSYVASALGQVPRKHWRHLSRALVGREGYRGTVSWTGTMFEYMMPELLLPIVPNSLIAESAKFAVYCQMRANPDLPWGISESAYYRADGWGYRAHGVRELALYRTEKQDRVVAPYASFLALAAAPREAVANLRRIMETGAAGRFGPFEALDYTPEGDLRPVKIYMAHHVGMSLAAVCNALTDGALQRYFMKNARMGAYRELLMERLPIGERLSPPAAEARRVRRRTERYEERITACNAQKPLMLPLCGGDWTLMAGESGKTRAVCRDMDIYRFEPGAAGYGGVALYLERGGDRVPLTPWPEYREDVEYETAFRPGEAVFTSRGEGFAAEVRCSAGENGEVRRVRVTGNGRDMHLIAEFEPVLCRKSDFDAHPAFRRLCLEFGLEKGALRVTRRGGASVWVRLPGAEFTTERGGFRSYTPEPRVTASAPIRPGEVLALEISITPELVKIPPRPGLEATAASLGMDAEEVRGAILTTPGLWSPMAAGKEALWPFGISGDRPVIAALAHGEAPEKGLPAVLRCHAFLWDNGVKCDLALLVTDFAEYSGRQRATAEAWLREKEREGLGSVHILDAEKALPVLSRAASVFLDGTEPGRRRGARPLFSPAPKRSAAVSWRRNADGSVSFEGLPPVAWANILTNGRFGAVVTDSGTGYAWLNNAHEARLTPWISDAEATEGAERLTIDGVSLFGGRTTYGFGWASCESTAGRVTEFVPQGADARVMIIEGRGRVRYSTRLALGPGAAPPPFAVSDGLCASVPGGLGLRLYSSEKCAAQTGSRRSLEAGMPDGAEGRGEDCVIAAEFESDGRLVLALGCEGAESALADAEGSLERTKRYWSELVRREHDTGIPELDRWANGWGTYQILASRVLGRTGLYQSGGAWGLRDQLQDVVALLPEMPELCREHLIRAFSHQYREGDAMHWWHPSDEGDRGVRTRISDDYLWPVWALCEYVRRTEDASILNEQAPWLISPELGEGERDRYERAVFSGETAALIDHAKRAAELFMRRGVGEHGLSRMLAGDWNDGMDRVGGESLWLSRFGAIALRGLAELTGEGKYSEYADGLNAACERCWEGDRYLRGYWADGTPLGSKSSAECKIDSVAQSFSTFAGGDPERCRIALKTAKRELFDRENGLVRLFTPPFDAPERDPGYIADYCPGFRENGGQYTHAAVWLALAMVRAGLREDAEELIRAIMPENKPTETYRAEPYVLAGDVSAAEGQKGRAGWTWYTGAAGWMMEVVRELEKK